MPSDSKPRFGQPADVFAALSGVGYLPEHQMAQVVFLAERLSKPILVEGPAGVGKTELAKALAAIYRRRLIRLQCYEGLDEARSLYEWNYRKQLLRLQADQHKEWDELEGDIFEESFLLARPLLEAIRSPNPVVLLVDEVDRLEIETEALLLEVLADFQVSIPELGTVTASSTPLVVVTSNGTRDLSEALKRRCLFLHIGYPALDRERAILLSQVPELPEALADQAARMVQSIRTAAVRKPPSIAESIDWARTLLALGVEELDEQAVGDTLHVLLKYQADIEAVAKELGLPATVPE